MGQDQSQTRTAAALVPDRDAFHRRVALLRPPTTVMQHCLGVDGYEAGHHACRAQCRLLRSIGAGVVCWSGAKLLPEQWPSVLGGHVAFVFFFDSGVDVDAAATRQALHFCVTAARDSSPDAAFFAVHWAGDESLPSPARRAPAATRRSPSPMPVVPPAADSAELPPYDLDAAGNDTASSRTEEDEAMDLPDFASLASEVGIDVVVRIDRAEQLLALECVLAEHLMPVELQRPLACLLYDLADACGAREAWLLDSATMLPLLSTCDAPLTAASAIVGAIGVLRSPLRRMMERMATEELQFVAIAVPGTRVVVGWACRPFAYVLLLVPAQGSAAVIGDALLQANLERYHVHFSNVIHNTTLTRRHTPIMQPAAASASPSPRRGAEH